MQDNTKQLVFTTLGVLAGGALLYYLSRDDSASAQFDPKVHKVDVIHQILDEICLETSCATIRTYNQIQTLIEQGKPVSQSDFARFQQDLDEEMRPKKAAVFASFPGYSEETVASWVRSNLKDPRQMKRAAFFEKMRNDVYVKCEINPTDFDLSADLPPEMTKEMYVRTARKVFATLTRFLRENLESQSEAGYGCAVAEPAADLRTVV